MKKQLKKSVWYLWQFFAITLFILAIFYAILRISSPFVYKIQEPLITYLQKRINAPLHFDSIALKWKGNTLELTLNKVEMHFLIGDEIHLKMNKLQADFNLFSWIYQRNLQLNQTRIDDLEIDITLKSKVNRLRDKVEKGLEYFPKLGQVNVQHASLNLFNRENRLLLHLENLTGNAYPATNDTKNQIDIFLLDKYLSQEQARLSILWEDKQKATLYLEAKNLNAHNFSSKENIYFSGEVWGEWQRPELAWMKGSLRLKDDQQEHMLSFKMQDQSPRLGYWYQIQVNNSRLQALVSDHRYILQADQLDLQTLQPWLPDHFAKILTNFSAKQIKLTAYPESWEDPFQTKITEFSIQNLDLALNIQNKDLDINRFSFSGKQKSTAAENTIDDKNSVPSTSAGFKKQPLSRHQSGEIIFAQTPITIQGNFFSIPLTNANINGSLSWSKDQKQTIITPVLQVMHKQTKVDASGTLSYQAIPSGQKMAIIADLYGQGETSNITDGINYLPNLFPPSVHKWIKQAKLEGQLSSPIIWKLKGDLSQFPFKNAAVSNSFDDSIKKTNEFNIQIPFQKINFTPDEKHLPRFNHLNGELSFHNQSMYATGNGNIIKDAQVNNIDVKIKDFQKPLLEIQGKAQAPLIDYIDFVRQSPALKSLHPLLELFKAEDKQSNLDLKLQIPLQDDAAIDRPKESIAHSISLQGKLRLHNANIIEKKTKTTLKAIQGEIAFDEQGLLPSKQNLRFTIFDQKAQLSIKKEASSYIFVTNGAFDLNKILAHYLPISTQLIRFHGKAQLAGELIFSHQKDANDEEFRLNVKSNFANVGVDAPFGLDINPSTQLPVTFVLSKTHSRANIKIHYGQLFSINTNLRTQTHQPQIENLHLKLSTDASDGYIDFSKKHLDMKFSSLLIPPSWNPKSLLTQLESSNKNNLPFAKNSNKTININTIPTFNIQIKNIFQNNQYIGELNAHSSRNAQNYHIDNFHFTSNDVFELTFKGKTDFKQNSTASLTINSYPGALVNESLGIRLDQDGFIKASANFSTARFWNRLGLSDIHAQGSALIKNGFLRKVEVGPLRMLAALNLDTLTKRLQLDFSDFYDEGLAFNRIEIPFFLESAKLHIDNSNFDGPAGSAFINGHLDLKSRSYDLALAISSNTNIAIPVIGTLTAGPAIGAGLLVAEQILDTQVDTSLFRFNYTLKGNWDNPQLEAKKQKSSK